MAKGTSLLTLEELKKLRPPLRNINVAHRESLSALERLALGVTRRVGSMGFFVLIVIWTAGWLSWNLAAPKPFRFDPFPAFVLWLFISNVIQLFLLPLILVGQNLQSRHFELDAEIDHKVNLKAEREVEAVLLYLEQQQESISKILEHMEKNANRDITVQ
ncbi:MAG: DUF1003 domain-containing protein [bacterium]|nr:DUF1003 domain-containing protein [bacterium]MDZ4296096.1 DUF1003 domain-containing protein [Patescibacteria group bacterium]